MIKRTIIVMMIALLTGISGLRADEGMWIPLLLEKYNHADMQSKGLKLSAEEIFSINQTSLKDAIVLFGRGCTGELISNQGLLITNHHCGYVNIQSHSSLEHDYLTNGFWAMSQKEELINKGLSVTFLVRMEDVTEKVLADVTEEMSEKQRQEKIKATIGEIKKEAVEGTHYKAVIKPFYYGNEYYLFVNEVYNDVRLVGAPPSAIGKFGGDTDNWMWPRHTGDFSMFRIYADKDNQPAAYSPENVPYKPKKHFSISMKGIKKGDFTMVYGYPGTTQEYLPSYAVENILNISNPHKINIRKNILNIMNTDMNADPLVRIQYSTKSARVANAWKKWIGESRGLKRLNAVEKKKEIEREFEQWYVQSPERRNKYSRLMLEFQKNYKGLEPYTLAIDYFMEAGYSMELVKFASSFARLAAVKKDTKQEDIDKLVKGVQGAANGFFKNYNEATDRKIFSKIFLDLYYNNVPKEFQPDIFRTIEEDFGGDVKKYEEFLYNKTMLIDQEKVNKFLSSFSASKVKKLMKDPAFQLYKSVVTLYHGQLLKPWQGYMSNIDSLMRTWMTVQREMAEDKILFPDANLTLRITYGQVNDYFPRDGVYYEPFTTLEGIMEKDNPEIYDYDVPDRLKELYESKEYGQYGVDGEMPVCFIGTNHTTGGNSGSPVLNADGHMIGINFDRNWEGTMSDIMYDPDMCRNITLDIRYALFLVDKFAGATHLIEELDLVF